MKMRWQTIASSVSIRTISPTATPLPKAYGCVAVYIVGRRTNLVVYDWRPKPATKKRNNHVIISHMSLVYPPFRLSAMLEDARTRVYASSVASVEWLHCCLCSCSLWRHNAATNAHVTPQCDTHWGALNHKNAALLVLPSSNNPQDINGVKLKFSMSEIILCTC